MTGIIVPNCYFHTVLSFLRNPNAEIRLSHILFALQRLAEITLLDNLVYVAQVVIL